MIERSSFFLWVGAHRRSVNIAGLILVLVLSVICYHAVAGFEFLTWDDPQQILENQLVLDSPGVENTLKIFGSTVISHYQPLTTLSMNIVNWLFGTDPGAFHLFSLLLHLANVALVYLLVSRLFPGSILPFFVAAFFAVHPMRVESVAWITEQKGLLSSLFLLSSLLVYTGIDWSREGRKTGRYVLSVVLFILAMLSKASAISLPFILLGYELLLKRRRLSRRVLLRLAPFAAAGLLLMLPTLLAHGDTGGFRPLAGLGVLDRTAIVVRNLFFYLRATLLPAGLSTVYAVPDDLISLRTFAVALALAGGVLLLIFNRRLRSSRMFLFGAVFYLVSIAPMLQVVPFGRSPAANRFSYLASLGVLICLAVLLRKLWRAFRWSRIPLILLAAGALTASCVSTSERLEIWRDSVSLWTDVLVENPDLSFAYYNLGQYYLISGDPGRAMEYYDRAIEIDSTVAGYYINRGNLLQAGGRPDLASNDYVAALRIDPEDPAIRFNLGNALRQMGYLEEASNEYRYALQLDPSMADGWLNLGSCLAQMGRYPEALHCFDRALQEDSTLETARNNRLRLLQEMGGSVP